MTTDQPTLSWDVYVVAGIPMAIAAGADGYGPPPGHTGRSWSPIAATLICGERDAVLVDPLMTVGQGRALADWVAATGKNLTTVYVTHGHGDHWLGLAAIRDRFPRVRAVAYRMLGSLANADDAVQDAWLRLSRSDAKQIDNLGGWLTTVVARECLHMLRSRRLKKSTKDAGRSRAGATEIGSMYSTAGSRSMISQAELRSRTGDGSFGRLSAG